jgi:hypothetical protein
MRLSRQSRFFASLLALLSLLFTQLAVAGYACPSMQIAQAMGSVATLTKAAAAVDQSDMPGCGGMDSEESVLCQNHGQVVNQSFDKAEVPAVLPFMASMPLQTVIHADGAYQATISHTPSSLLARSTAPPLSIRNCCFRI